MLQRSYLFGNCIFLLHNSVDVSILRLILKWQSKDRLSYIGKHSSCSAVQDTVSEERLTELYPEISEAKQSNPVMANLFLGLVPALIWILFFA